jgi:hypothetical protein
MNTLATHAPFSGPFPENLKAPSITTHSTPSMPARPAKMRWREGRDRPASGRIEKRSTVSSMIKNTDGAGRPR